MFSQNNTPTTLNSSPFSDLSLLGNGSRTAWEELSALLSQVPADTAKELYQHEKFIFASGTIINRFIQYLMTLEYGNAFFRTDSHSRYLAEDLLKTCQDYIRQAPTQHQLELERLRFENSLLAKQLSEMKKETPDVESTSNNSSDNNSTSNVAK